MKSLLFLFAIVLFSCRHEYNSIPIQKDLAFKSCASVVDLDLIKKTNPQRYKAINELELFTNKYIGLLQTSRLSGNSAKIIVPVVVHVMHRGEAVGVGRNVSDANIASRIASLNQDCRKLNPDIVNVPAPFQQLTGDANIEFKLTCVDPNGNPTTGITRHYASKDSYTYNGNLNPDGSVNEQAVGLKFSSLGGADAWPTNKYLNIWICEISDSGGFAQFPDEYATKPTTDGIALHYLYIGRVITHEVGHWLNLRHIWGDAYCGNDFVDDTPTQGWLNDECRTFPSVTCNNGPYGDMFMNYMDAGTQNGCAKMFTQGQVTRMRANFITGGVRASFINNYFRLVPTAGPTCTFTVNNLTCLPVTWTVVQGSATIVSGQGTNSVTLSTPSTYATVKLRAEVEGYFDEAFVQVGAVFPVTEIITEDVSPSCFFITTRFTAIGSLGATTYKWYYRRVGQIGWSLRKTSSENFYDLLSGRIIGCQNIEIKVEAYNNCSTTPVTFQITTQVCGC